MPSRFGSFPAFEAIQVRITSLAETELFWSCLERELRSLLSVSLELVILVAVRGLLPSSHLSKRTALKS